tara:strand:- start:86 stop:412 length:327 start_codon:yes stop_codon:yes gene_type:complete
MTVRALKKKNNMPDKLIPGKKRTMAYSKSSGFKMKGYSYPGVSPMKDEKGSDQEVNVVDDRDYVDSSTGVVKTAAMERLLRAKPDANSKGYASWKKAYDRAKAAQLAN